MCVCVCTCVRASVQEDASYGGFPAEQTLQEDFSRCSTLLRQGGEVCGSDHFGKCVCLYM